jgi:hypothetical protein
MESFRTRSVSIHQPNYIPWLGYFYKIYQTNYFVFLDDVQFSNEGMHNYHYIKTLNGPQRIRIPVFQTMGDKINEVRIKNELNWREKHLNLLRQNYKDACHFDEIYSDFSSLINESNEFLYSLNISIIKFLCRKLGIKTEFIKSSDLNISTQRETKIIEICTALQCDTYYSGTGARSYQKEEHFLNKDIRLKYSEYQVLRYIQQYSGFQSNVTILDFLMNCGYRWDMVIEKQIACKGGQSLN